MKPYLIVAVLSLLGILAISLRNTNITKLAEIPKEFVRENFEKYQEASNKINPEFKKYWYVDSAEITGYDLKQSEFGALHTGKAIMVFSTEAYSSSNSNISIPSVVSKPDHEWTLKLNSSRSFLTGIYPHALMTTTFNTINNIAYEKAYKLSMGGQDWLGQSYYQLKLNGNKYNCETHTYDKSESDRSFELKDAFLEDEIMNIIRLNPELLPVGEVEIIPSLTLSYLTGAEVRPYQAEITSERVTWNGLNVMSYTISYAHNERIIKIYYHSDFPYYIEGWEDTYKGLNGEELTSSAVRRQTKLVDIWNTHDNEHRYLYNELFR